MDKISPLVSFLPFAHLFHTNVWWNLRKLTASISMAEISEREDEVTQTIICGHSVTVKMMEPDQKMILSHQLNPLQATQNYRYNTPVARRYVPFDNLWLKAQNLEIDKTPDYEVTCDWFALPGFEIQPKALPIVYGLRLPTCRDD